MTVTNIPDRERAKDALIRQLSAGRDVLAQRVGAMKAALFEIAALDPAEDSSEGYNERGEADCFRQAQEIAREAMKEHHD